jgi:predicted NBD/HSP70 family sugar kinase
MDTADIRQSNSQLVLSFLWKLKMVSRAELARLTGLSRPSISTIVEDFLVRGLVSEQGLGESNGGRRPVILRFEDDAFAIIGCELGAKHIRLMLCNMRGKELGIFEEACTTGDDPEATLDILSELLQQVQRLASTKGCRILGMGVGLASPVYTRQGTISLHPAIYHRWKGIDLMGFLAQQAHLPVWFGNDAKLGALAELWWSQDPNLKHLLYIQLAQGLGAGVILDRKIQSGAHGLAGEIGSAPGLAAHFPDLAEGSKKSVRELESSLRSLAQIVANSVLMWDPETLVLGGDLSSLNEEAWQFLQTHIRAQLVWPELKELSLQRSRFGSHQTALGAATLVLDRFLTDASFSAGLPMLSQPARLTESRDDSSSLD